jgi:hypothetical protein
VEFFLRRNGVWNIFSYRKESKMDEAQICKALVGRRLDPTSSSGLLGDWEQDSCEDGFSFWNEKGIDAGVVCRIHIETDPNILIKNISLDYSTDGPRPSRYSWNEDSDEEDSDEDEEEEEEEESFGALWDTEEEYLCELLEELKKCCRD